MKPKAKEQTKTCPWCNETFTTTNLRKMYCCSKCSSSYTSWCIRTKKKYGLLTERQEVSKKQFFEIHNFLQEMKSKSYIADLTDVFRLIHYYDVAFPHLENLPKPSQPEKSVIEMFSRLAVWWKAKKTKYNL
jgi:hypothetical protein